MCPRASAHRNLVAPNTSLEKGACRKRRQWPCHVRERAGPELGWALGDGKTDLGALGNGMGREGPGPLECVGRALLLWLWDPVSRNSVIPTPPCLLLSAQEQRLCFIHSASGPVCAQGPVPEILIFDYAEKWQSTVIFIT